MTQTYINNGGANIPIDYTIVEKDAYESQLILQKSIITGSRRWVNPSIHTEFNILVMLFKYDNPDTELNTLLGYKGQTVTFKPNNFYGFITDNSGVAVDFFIADVIPFNTKQNTEFDYVLMKFFSAEYVSYQPTILRKENDPESDDGNPIITDDDKFIILDL